jgi:hypothetical protein
MCVGNDASATSGGPTKMGGPPAQAPGSIPQQGGGPSMMGPGGMGTVTDDSPSIGLLGAISTVASLLAGPPGWVTLASGAAAYGLDKALDTPSVSLADLTGGGRTQRARAGAVAAGRSGPTPETLGAPSDSSDNQGGGVAPKIRPSLATSAPPTPLGAAPPVTVNNPRRWPLLTGRRYSARSRSSVLGAANIGKTLLGG